MARTADHAARREQLSTAVRSLVATSGVDAVTVAGVAREAGVSVGLVQHYFPSKDALLIGAHGACLAQLEARVESMVVAGEQRGETIAAMMARALPLYLPLDAERRADHGVRLGLLARSGVGEQTRAAAHEHGERLRLRIAQAIANGKKCGEVDAGADPEAGAWEIVSVVTGLADLLYTRGVEERGQPRVETVVSGVISHWVNGPCARAVG